MLVYNFLHTRFSFQSLYRGYVKTVKRGYIHTSGITTYARKAIVDKIRKFCKAVVFKL